MYRNMFRMALLGALFARGPVIPVRAATSGALGRTHFILGKKTNSPQPTPVVRRTLRTGPQRSGDTCSKVLFAPRDNIRDELIHLIESEKKGISVATYVFTDEKIAEALAAAHANNRAVHVVADPSCLKMNNNKLGFLANRGIEVSIYDPQRAGKSSTSLMHHKFLHFAQNKEGHELVATGSYNLTRNAQGSNCENLVVLDDDRALQYAQQFEWLKKVSYRYSDPPAEEGKTQVIVAKNKRSSHRAKKESKTKRT